MDRGVDRTGTGLKAEEPDGDYSTSKRSLSLRFGIRGWLLAAIPLVFLTYLFIYPVSRILWISLTAEGGGFAEVWASGRIRGAAWFTLWQAVVSTVLTVLLALPLTAVVARYRFLGRDLVRALITVPFVLPTVVVGSAFVALGLTGSAVAVIAAHVFYNLAVVVRTVGGVWSRIDPSLVEAARTMGASRLRAFREVTWPLLAPAFAAASAIVFLFCFTSFGVVLILGGLRLRTIEVEIYQQAISFLDLPTAGALAVVQLVAVGAIMAIYGRVQEQRAVRFKMVPESTVLRRPSTFGTKAAVWTTVGLTLGAVSLPPLMLVYRSLDRGGAGWRFLLDPGRLALRPAEAVANSLVFSLVAATIAVVVGLLAATVITRFSSRLSRFFDIALMLPLGTSAVTIGFGFLVALDRPIDLRATVLLVPLAHALVAVPFVVRATVPTLRAIRTDLREAAAVLGASPRRVWREVDLPLTARALAVGAGFAGAVSLGEFGATSFIVRPDTSTVPTLIFRLLSRPGSVTFAGAMAMSVILMLLTAGLIMAVDRFRAGDLGTF